MMQLTYASCFCTDQSSSGNPAAVVEEFPGDDCAKQQLATKLNLPVTVFVEKVNNIFTLQFFYPVREMPLCIHGALVAAQFLMAKLKLDEIYAETKDKHKLIFTREDDAVQLEIDRGEVIAFNLLPTRFQSNA